MWKALPGALMLRNETVRVAVEALWSNKLRAFLTTLGVVIGSACIVLVITVAITGRQYVIGQIEGVGSNMVFASYEVGSQQSSAEVNADFIKMSDIRTVREQLGRRIVAATGIASEGVKEEFDEHAKEEQGHMREVAERINQLGGKPNFDPEGLASRSASQYGQGGNLVEMIKENLIAERIACEHV